MSDKLESGIYTVDENAIFIVFGGKINIGVGQTSDNIYKTIGIQELNENAEIGVKNPEPWDKNKSTIHLLFDKKEEIDVFIKNLKRIRKNL